jgi:hypothetical protein
MVQRRICWGCIRNQGRIFDRRFFSRKAAKNAKEEDLMTFVTTQAIHFSNAKRAIRGFA